MTDEEIAQKESAILNIAGHAQVILGNPLWQQVFTLYSAKLVKNILSTKPQQLDVREHNFLKYKVVHEIEAELTEAVNSGKIVAKTQEQRDYQAAVVKEDED